MKKAIFPLAVALTLLAGCDTEEQAAQQLDTQLDEAVAEGPDLSDEVLRDLLQSIPAPLEISMLIKETGAPYDRATLNDASRRSDYNTNYQKALNLGIYGTDLGYTNLYGQSQDGIDYMQAVRDLADGLQIGQFFDFDLIRRLAGNADNLDSLLLITTQNFQQINQHLQERDRTNLSLLILTGGWLEALHLTTAVVQSNPNNPELKEKVGEQKLVMDRVMLLLEAYQSDPQIALLYRNMKELKAVFDEIEIVQTYEEPVMEEIDGIMMMVDRSTSTVYITDEQLERIGALTGRIRNKMTASN
ncbi:MAG: hypothetical protein WBA12_10315 [Catalinimonas sp.]